MAIAAIITFLEAQSQERPAGILLIQSSDEAAVPYMHSLRQFKYEAAQCGINVHVKQKNLKEKIPGHIIYVAIRTDYETADE